MSGMLYKDGMRVGFIPTLFFCKIIIKLLLNYIFNNDNKIINPIKENYMV